MRGGGKLPIIIQYAIVMASSRLITVHVAIIIDIVQTFNAYFDQKNHHINIIMMFIHFYKIVPKEIMQMHC